jgi:chitosanase
MKITEEQKKVIDAILCIFETGKLPSTLAYSSCSILSDGAGISYGKHQSTDKGGALDKIVELYIEKGGIHSESLKPFLSALATNETSKVSPTQPPEWAKELILLLKEAGKDPVMQECQDVIFDSCYWIPALGHVDNIGATSALSHLVVYDTCIHSGPGGVANIRSKFPEPSPKRGGDEKIWVTAYIKARREWLASHKNPLVQKTVYRMDALNEIVKSNNWDLKTPMVVKGVKIG